MGKKPIHESGTTPVITDIASRLAFNIETPVGDKVHLARCDPWSELALHDVKPLSGGGSVTHRIVSRVKAGTNCAYIYKLILKNKSIEN